MLGSKSHKVTPTIREPDARHRLAAAIDDAAKAEAIQAEDDAALMRAREMVRVAESDLAAAVSSVTAAREAFAEEMVAAAKSGAPATPGRALAEARQVESQAFDMHDAAQAALASVSSRHGHDQSVRRAAEQLQSAAADVVRPMIEPTIDEAMRAHRDWVLARNRLHFLHGICFPEVLATQESRRVLHVANGDTVDADEGLRDMEGRWLEAFEMLKRDASAALPWEA